MGKGRIIDYNEIRSSSRGEFTYCYSLETEQQLINLIRLGDYDKSEQVISEVFQTILADDSISLQTAKCLIFDIVATMMKTIDEINTACKTNIMEELNPAERLLRCKTVQDMQTQMMYILREVCQYIQNRKKSHNYRLRDDVLQYIQDHYNDPNMSISGIAGHFGISMTYLSKFFKEQTGENLLDCINRYRLEKAKQLLKQSHSNIGKVAVMVGFYNSNALIRVFKKYEGITPGKFKEME